MVDEGCQGATDNNSSIHPKKVPPHCMLSIDEEWKNMKIGSDITVVENVFEGLCILSVVIGSRFRSDQSNYDVIFILFRCPDEQPHQV